MPVDITQFTPEQRRLFTQAASFGTGVQTIDGTAPTITPKSLESTSAFNLPEPIAGTSPDSYKAIIGAGAESLTELIKLIQAPAAEEKTRDTLRTDIFKSLDSLSGKAGRTSALEMEKGIPDQTKRLQETELAK